MAKRTAKETRPALEQVPPEAILVAKLDRLLRDITTVVAEIKATLPQSAYRARPNAQRLIEEFGQREINGRGR